MRLLKDFRVRQKVNFRAALRLFTDNRQEAVFQFRGRNALRIAVLVDHAATADTHPHPFGERVHDGGTHAVQAAARLIGVVVELSAGMQGRHDHTLGRDPLPVQLHRNTAPVVAHGTGTILLEDNVNLAAIAREVLIDCIVHNLVNQVVQRLLTDAADVHAGAFSDRIEPLQHGDAVSRVLCLCHPSPSVPWKRRKKETEVCLRSHASRRRESNPRHKLGKLVFYH